MNVFTLISRPSTALVLSAAVLLLSACGTNKNDQPPGAISANEARALDEAEEMITSGRPADTAASSAAGQKAPIAPPANAANTKTD